MRHQERLAKAVRVITLPPVMVVTLTIALCTRRGLVFSSPLDVGAALFFLAMTPFLAYPLQKWIPKYKEAGREGQRKLAFLFNILGYAGAWWYGLITHAADTLQLLYNSYLLSVLLLFAVNKLLKIRASGHACATAAPTVFAGYFLGASWAAFFLLLTLSSVWASVTLKRHKLSDMVLGMLVFLCAFFTALLFS